MRGLKTSGVIWHKCIVFRKTAKLLLELCTKSLGVLVETCATLHTSSSDAQKLSHYVYAALSDKPASTLKVKLHSSITTSYLSTKLWDDSNHDHEYILPTLSDQLKSLLCIFKLEAIRDERFHVDFTL